MFITTGDAGIEHIPRTDVEYHRISCLVWDTEDMEKQCLIQFHRRKTDDANLIFDQALQYLHSEGNAPLKSFHMVILLVDLAVEMAPTIKTRKSLWFDLEAGFTSVNQMLQSISLDMPGFLTTGFENDQKLEGFAKPFFYFVGDKDHYFPQMFQSKYSKDQRVIAT